ncbi:MAG: hypothetical protein NC347_00370 [Clostridium sp.]|nr:hypothetical protein [Clostridium sp.]
MVKKLLLSFVLVIMLILMMPSVNARAADISLPKKMTLSVADGYRQKKTLRVKTADGVRIKTAKYAASKKNIAKVNKKGQITAVKQGKAIIKAKVTYEKKKKTYKKTLKCRVTVKKAVPKLSETEHTMEEGDSFRLDLLYAKNKHIQWSNSDTSVAKFGSVGNGYVYILAKGPGTAMITCRCEGHKLICIVNVNGEETEAEPETGEDE